jgi:putative sterol carrier protein
MSACAGYRRTMSQIYAGEAQFEALFTQMFDRIETDDPDGMDELVEQEMVIRFRLRKPDVELWIDGRSKPVQTSFGAQELDATLTADLTANSLHELLLGTLPLGSAILFRKLKVQGSKSKAMKLESLLHAMQAVYPGLVDER